MLFVFDDLHFWLNIDIKFEETSEIMSFSAFLTTYNIEHS